MKNKTRKCFQVLFKQALAKDIEYPSQIESSEYQTHIRRRMFDGLFSHDIIKAPLSFDDDGTSLNHHNKKRLNSRGIA